MMIHYSERQVSHHTQRARAAGTRIKPTDDPLRFWASSGSVDGHWWPVKVSEDLLSADCGCPATVACRHGAPCIFIARRNAEQAAWEETTRHLDTIAAYLGKTKMAAMTRNAYVLLGKRVDQALTDYLAGRISTERCCHILSSSAHTLNRLAIRTQHRYGPDFAVACLADYQNATN